MLKISITKAADKEVTLHLEGKVSGRCVECLEKTCEVELQQCARVAIDLAGVSFLDRDGMALLRNLVDCGVELLNPSSFIRELMKNTAPL